MRILYWSHVFPPQIGGVEVIASKFLPAMQQRGYEFTVISSHNGLTLPDQTEYENTPVHRFRLWHVLAEHDLAQLWQITQSIGAIKRHFKPDLVHLNYWEPSLFFHLRTAGISPAPLLVSFHGPPPEHFRDDDTTFRHAMSSATWITAVSAGVLDRVRALTPEVTPRSSLIYNGLEFPARAPTPLPFDPPTLLCLGRLVPQKGFDLAIRALAQLTPQFPSLRLTIAGGGAERGKLEALTRELGLEDRVEFIGWVPPADVPLLMNAATLVVMPSRWEGLPGVAIQAAQMARPVVGARTLGMPEVVLDQQTGLLVDDADVSGLARAVAHLLDHPARAVAMGHAARRRAREVFTWQDYLDAHDALYKKLVTRGNYAHATDLLPSQ